MYNTIEAKQHDYDHIVRTIDSAIHMGHVDTIYTMINLFNEKWKPSDTIGNIEETIELRGVLKYKIKKLGEA
jgi:hypothetical protein